MSFNRFALCLLLCLGLAFTAQAGTRDYSLSGGGGELAIGQGLPLPAQVFTPGMTGTNFPPLLVPANTKKILKQTTTRTTRMQVQMPQSVLFTVPIQQTVGLFAQNPTLYAVATNLGWGWPAQPAVLSTAARPGPVNVTYNAQGGSIRYSNAAGLKFGGPARFAITYGAQPQGRIVNSPVTIYAVAVRPTGNPPCTHPALIPPFGGTYSNPACVGALGGAWPLTQGVIGAAAGVTATTTPQGNPKPGIGIGKFGASPAGTVTFFTWTGGNASGFTNQATSAGFPWTTGMLTISHPLAAGVGEVFTITGGDNRTTMGAGTIQLVAGSLSNRKTSGPNANRGWVRLQLAPRNIPVPSMSPAGLAATAGLMLLAVGYVVRRRISS